MHDFTNPVTYYDYGNLREHMMNTSLKYQTALFFYIGDGKKDLVDLHRTFGSTDSQSLIGVNKYKGEYL